MKILLTGASGNLGQTIQRIGRDHSFVTVGRENWSEAQRQIESVDVIIHAASDLKTSAATDPGGLMRSNVMSTVELLKMIDPVRKPRLFFISSCAVYGHSEITKEDVQPAPISLNGISKLLNERLISEFCSNNAIDFTILRAFNTFGGRDRFSIIHRLEESLEKKKPFILFNDGLSQRDFVHVEDVAAIVLELIQRPTGERILNVGSGEAVKIKEILNEFRRLYPQLEVVHRVREEAEYSRANISRLREVLPNYEFRCVLDFIRSGLKVGTSVN